MNAPRLAFAVVTVLTSVLLEIVLLSRLGLPGATPDLVLVVVAALALVRGPAAGACIGFAAGLLLDVAPPADGDLGTYAFLLALVGYLVGLRAERAEGSVWQSIAVVAGVAALLVLGRAALGGLLGDPRVVWGDVPGLVGTEMAYAAFLAVFLVPLVAAIDRRLGPEPARVMR